MPIYKLTLDFGGTNHLTLAAESVNIIQVGKTYRSLERSFVDNRDAAPPELVVYKDGHAMSKPDFENEYRAAVESQPGWGSLRKIR